ncbi:MAG TPA: glycosyltransferase family 4 protein [Thermoanaerobaculia bacterium]|nr:glycosyltransferase family 4 protein [Thermoanaerobaculia bacterium]
MKRICICGAQVPFLHGGAEILVESLRDELAARGFQVDIVKIPFHWPTRVDLLKSGLAWRLIDLTAAAREKIDLVIATRFPSYLVKHPNKVVWLVHQLRQAYDLLGTPHSDFREWEPTDRKALEMVRAMDRRALSEARRVFTISQNTADRLQRFNHIAGQALYPPPKLGSACHAGDFGDYVFSVGRLDKMKRFDLLIRALGHTETGVRCKIAGTGPEEEPLRQLIARLGLENRVELLGWVEDRDLVELYAGSLGVFYAPYDEDYGYVTIEAFKSGKPVVTTADSGGVLEFVEDGVNGFVCPPEGLKALGARLDHLYRDRAAARTLGLVGFQKVREIGWDRTIEALIGQSIGQSTA